MSNDPTLPPEITADLELTDDELNTRIDSSERWRQHIASGAWTFANDGIKSLIYLNGGTVVALPALKGLSDSPNFSELWLTVFLFLLGLISATVAQFLAYFAMSSGAYIHLHGGRYWKTIKELKRSNSQAATAQNYKQLQFNRERMTAIQEVTTLSFAAISLICFIIGGFTGVASFYPS